VGDQVEVVVRKLGDGLPPVGLHAEPMPEQGQLTSHLRGGVTSALVDAADEEECASGREDTGLPAGRLLPRQGRAHGGEEVVGGGEVTTVAGQGAQGEEEGDQVGEIRHAVVGGPGVRRRRPATG
jgi:hypothetical protein